MNESANFYATLAPYYDRLFPAEPSVVSFLKSCGATPGATVLDVACGTGAYVEALARSGVHAYGVDLSPEMIAAAQRRAEAVRDSAGAARMHVAVADMLDLDLDVSWPETFHLVYCIGNSLSHLPTREDVEQALRSFARRLPTGAALVLQTVSMEEIPVGGKRQLPSLTGAGLRMERTYTRVETQAVAFTAKLTTPRGNAEITNRLLLIGEEWLQDALARAGFDDVGVYGGYDRSAPEPDAWVRVYTARRCERSGSELHCSS